MYSQEQYNRTYTIPGQGRSLSFPAVMKNVYIWMAQALAMTGLTAMAVATQSQLVATIFGNKALFFGLILAELGLVFYLSARIMKMSFASAGLAFGIYAVLNGITLSGIFLAYTMESIAQTFFVTAGTFGAMGAVGLFIKKDLSAIGRILFMALIGLIIATVVNMFFKNSTIMMLCNYAGVLIFTGLTAYDTQRIKNMLQQYGEEQSETTMKLALLGSLMLYLDFINLFLYLLRFFGSSRD